MENNFNLSSAKKKLSCACDSFEICFSKSSNDNINFENNKLSSIESREGAGAGFRIIKDKKIGFSFTTNPAKIKETINYALESSKFGEKAKFNFSKISKPNFSVNSYDKNIEKLDLLSLIPLGGKIIKKISSKIPDSLVSIGFSKSFDSDIFMNSNGVNIKETGTDFSASVGMNITGKNNGIIEIYESKTRSCLFPITDILKMSDTIIERYSLMKKKILPKPGAYPVIFNKYSIGFLFSCFLDAINGKVFQKGISPLSDKIGKQIIDKRISVYDDPSLDYMLGSYNFDGEGIPAYKKALIENGIFKNFIFDLRSASLVGASSTGNAGRAFFSHPNPSFGNITILSGDTAYSDMIKNIDEGLLVEQVIGAGQSNTLAGDISVNVDIGYWIKNGKIIGKVKDCMIAANVYDIFNNICSISRDLFIKSSMITPAICFNKINLF